MVTGVDWRGEVETVETVGTVVWRLSRGAEKSVEGGGGFEVRLKCKGSVVRV